MCLSWFKKKESPVVHEEVKSAPVDDGTRTFRFNAIPTSLAEFTALPEAGCRTEFEAAAMTLLALAAYTKNKEAALEMLDYLRGPRPLSNYDKSFLKDRFMDNGKYVPFSYFKGATPENEYTPNQPFEVTLKANKNGYAEEGYAMIDIRSSGADSVRQVKLRRKGDGQWCLWDQFLMVGIRPPKSQNPWA